MKKGLKVNLTDIKIQDISSSCIMLASKFSRLAKAQHGVIIKLQDPQVLNKIMSYSVNSDSSELKKVSQQIEIEVLKHLQKISPQEYDLVIKETNARDLLIRASSTKSI